MAKIIIGFSYTANLGNYESMKINLGIERDLEKGEKFDEAFQYEFSEIQEMVINKINELEDELKD